MSDLKFTKTQGHDKQKNMFLRALSRGHLAHAFVFCGEEGIGKTTFALELAGLLGAHPVLDIVLHDTAAGISVEEARTVQSRLGLTPAGKAKVAIITHAELMGDAAANSLLKTLEEPPDHSYIFLVTSNYYSLLPTIASRVMRINFSLHKAEDLLESAEANSEKLEFLKLAKKYYDVLEEGSLQERLAAAAEIAGKENDVIANFFKYAMRSWATSGKTPGLGTKLSVAWRDWQYNVNTKLLLDNLFLI